MPLTRRLLACTMIILLYYLHKLKREEEERRERIIYKRRRALTFFNSVFKPTHTKNPRDLFRYTRMSLSGFNMLSNLTKKYYNQYQKAIPKAITIEERLALTLHFLSQGVSIDSLNSIYYIETETVRKIIKDTCTILWEVLQPKYLKPPTTEDEWETIADAFDWDCHFPHCLGAMDAKHINIKASPHSGLKYFNFKKTFNIVLLACADTDYRITLVDIGAYSARNDGGIVRLSQLGHAMNLNGLNTPQDTISILGSDTQMPYTFVGNQAFPMKPYNVMRPYTGKNLEKRQETFNERLAEPQKIIESTFGILAARWRILQTTIFDKVSTIDAIVKAVVVLHNFALQTNATLYCPAGYGDSYFIEGDWRKEIQPLESVGRLNANNAPKEMQEIRDVLSHQFQSEGEERIRDFEEETTN